MTVFLALEGPKGVGKTTVITALHQRFDSVGQHRIVFTKEPTAAFDLAQEGQLYGYDLAEAITIDRAAHVTEVIRPTLAAGGTVICDRYILSSLVFHSIDGVPADDIWRLNEQFPLPDANLLLAAPPETTNARRRSRAARTRLEAATQPALEADMYLYFGHMMEERGSLLRVLPNETAVQFEQLLQWISECLETSIIL
jgi:dTMP kinase